MEYMLRGPVADGTASRQPGSECIGTIRASHPGGRLSLWLVSPLLGLPCKTWVTHIVLLCTGNAFAPKTTKLKKLGPFATT